MPYLENLDCLGGLTWSPARAPGEESSTVRRPATLVVLIPSKLGAAVSSFETIRYQAWNGGNNTLDPTTALDRQGHKLKRPLDAQQRSGAKLLFGLGHGCWQAACEDGLRMRKATTKLQCM